MKVIVFLALCSIASAGVIAPIAAPAIGLLSTGSSTQTRSQDGLGNYAFAYKESHGTGGSSRSESGNALGQVVGSYSLGVVDGRQRVVNYVADALGFRAAISTNEPGTAPQPAASSSISTPGAVVAAPLVAAPLAAAPLAAAPLAAAPLAAAPVVAAPALAYGNIAAAPLASYSTVVNHGIASPIGAHIAAPVAYGKTFAAPFGLAAPIYG